MVFWQSNDYKRVFNEVSLTRWCHATVHFEVKMNILLGVFGIVLNIHSHRQCFKQASLMRGIFPSRAISYAMSKTRTQLGRCRKS